ncbi:Hypothetical protein SCLAV_0561 [Streptomyces clavuligerus]|uniref:Uncharacterized protein n=1 Tax=Streptomyces clavuligerus TaxID=1901 RepID=E2PU18_STRCL|nr:Hypothetical protein SCLAV_0561 [Streptomyces clavuligerus]
MAAEPLPPSSVAVPPHCHAAACPGLPFPRPSSVTPLTHPAHPPPIASVHRNHRISEPTEDRRHGPVGRTVRRHPPHAPCRPRTTA